MNAAENGPTKTQCIGLNRGLEPPRLAVPEPESGWRLSKRGQM
jgi:hypothetical protein